MTPSPSRRGDERALAARLRRAFAVAIAACDPEQRVRAIDIRPGRRTLIVAAGKAAPKMAAGALARLAGHPVHGLCVTTDGVPAEGLAPLEVMRASHPLPDARSLAAAERALELARGLGPDDLLLALVSGGASSLLAAPVRGVPLHDKAALSSRLLDAGAPIASINAVRKHLSRVKGGRLAVAAGAARVVTLVVRDVIGGDLADVGSGPTLGAATDPAAVEAVLRRYAPADAEHWIPLLDAPPKVRPGEARSIVDPEQFADEMARALAGDFSVRVLPGDEGDVRAMAARRVEQAWQLSAGAALVIPAEPTVVLPSRRGRGGRAGLVALLAARDLPPAVALLAAATDGVDGDSGAAGAVVSRAACDALPRGAVDRAIARYDDAPIHRAAATALVVGATGTNVTDVHVLAAGR